MIIQLVTLGLFAGFGAGSLGIGMGVILTPVYISLGLNSIIASSTAMYVVLFSTSSASIVVCIFGRMNY
jgi:uncharacterized membrane protein YfcA